MQLCQEVLTHFPGESALFLKNFRAELGEFHFLAGEQAEGERVLLELIRDHPDCAAGYVRLADLLGYGPAPDRESIDQERAQELLGQWQRFEQNPHTSHEPTKRPSDWRLLNLSEATHLND